MLYADISAETHFYIIQERLLGTRLRLNAAERTAQELKML